MKEHKGLRLGLIAAAAVAVVLIGGLLVAQVSAAAHALTVGDAKAEVGETASVDVTAMAITDPGLGSWTIDVSWDSSIVTLKSCDPAGIGGAFNDCNDEFDTDTPALRIVGFVGAGLEGDTVLASLTFTCDVEGESPLTIDTTSLVLKDGTAGDPGQIGAALSDGSITCNVATEEPTEEPTLVGPTTGTGPLAEGSNGVSGWLIVALAGAGFAALAGFGALRLRTRQ